MANESCSPRKCPGCNESSLSTSTRFRGKRWRTYECLACGLHFVWPIPTEETISRYYQFERYGSFLYPEISISRGHREGIVAELLTRSRQLTRAPWRLLDVGCSTGDFLKLAARLGWQPFGTELDPTTAQIARARTDLPVFIGSGIDPVPRSSTFDAIMISHTLEHCRIPYDLLLEVNSRLVPGGALIIRVPNSSSKVASAMGRLWTWYCPPVHLYYFNRPSLDSLLTRAGFKPMFWSLGIGDGLSTPLEIASSFLRMAAEAVSPGRAEAERVLKSDPGRVAILRRLRSRLDEILRNPIINVEDTELAVIATKIRESDTLGGAN